MVRPPPGLQSCPCPLWTLPLQLQVRKSEDKMGEGILSCCCCCHCHQSRGAWKGQVRLYLNKGLWHPRPVSKNDNSALQGPKQLIHLKTFKKAQRYHVSNSLNGVNTFNKFCLILPRKSQFHHLGLPGAALKADSEQQEGSSPLEAVLWPVRLEQVGGRETTGSAVRDPRASWGCGTPR